MLKDGRRLKQCCVVTERMCSGERVPNENALLPNLVLVRYKA